MFCSNISGMSKKTNWVKGKANELNDNLPRSERWFLKRFKDKGLLLKNFDLSPNRVLLDTIPDYISHKYRVIVEIDGSIHNLEYIKENDKKKDKTRAKTGYQVIRVKAYNEISLSACIFKLKELKSNYTAMPIESKQDLKNKKEITKRKYQQYKGKGKCRLCRKAYATEIVRYKCRNFKYCKSCKNKLILK